eukprot:3194471-Lingulodinium_polyedra.AAC.1
MKRPSRLRPVARRKEPRLLVENALGYDVAGEAECAELEGEGEGVAGSIDGVASVQNERSTRRAM